MKTFQDHFDASVTEQFKQFVKEPIETSVTSDPAFQLILVRHAEPIPTEERTSDRLLDPSLSKRGEFQAKRTASALRKADLVAIYASDMRRCYQTAMAIATYHKVPIRKVHALREVEILRGLPRGKLLTDCLTKSEWLTAAEAFRRTGRWDAFPLSENSSAFRRRVRNVITRLAPTRRTGAVCIVTHGGVINAYLAEVLRLKRDYFFLPAHCSICRIGRRGNHKVVNELNATSHIEIGRRSA